MGHLGDTTTFEWFYLSFHLVWALALSEVAFLVVKGAPKLSMHVCTSAHAQRSNFGWGTWEMKPLLNCFISPFTFKLFGLYFE